jgi:hypothetical protein
MGVNPSTVERVCARASSPKGAAGRPISPMPSAVAQAEQSVIEGDTWQVSLPKTRIHTLEELVEHCKIDLSVWEVDRFVANKWEVGAKDADGNIKVEPLFQVKAFLRRNRVVEFAKLQVEELRKEAEQFSPKFPVIKQRSGNKSGNVAEYSIYDHHFGALIWGKETGAADYDTVIAQRAYEDALSALVLRTRDARPERALLVLGNDQQNADNRAGTTERGTQQSMDSRYQKVFDVSKRASLWAVDALLGEFGAVDIVIVPGNHDPLGAWHLGDTLASWYRRCKSVTVDNSPRARKYYEHGVNMLLFTHGNTGKLQDYGSTMAAEQPEMWGRTKWREAHTGDKHHRELLELKGATVRILPSLRPPCAWTSDNHYVGSLRAAEAYVWNKSEGLVATAVHSVLG